MSASSKKKLRKEEQAAALTVKQQQQRKDAKALKRDTIIFITVIALVLCSFVAILGIRAWKNYAITQRFTTAATIDGHKINAIEMNYYYVDAANEFYSNVSQQASGYEAMMLSAMGLDPKLPMNQQVEASSNQKWSDYLMEMALTEAQRDYVLCQAAKKAGFKLSEEDRATIKNIKSNLDMNAQFQGYASGNALIKSWYGEYARIDTYVDYYEQTLIADRYYEQYSASLTYDADAIAKADTNPIEYNGYSFSYYFLNYENLIGVDQNAPEATEPETTEPEATEPEATEPETTEPETTEPETTEPETTEPEATEPEATEPEAEKPKKEEKKEPTAEEKAAARAEAERIAKELEKCESYDALKEAIGKIKVSTGATQSLSDQKGVLYPNVNANYKEWLTSADRKTGDIKYFANEVTEKDADGKETKVINGYYIVYFKEMNDNKAKMANVRHLLIKTGTDAAASEKKANDLMNTWKSGAATEESFIELVKANTEDSGSKDNGGLYENISFGSSYVPEFEAWAIDPARKAKDVAVVKTEHGYHVMYFVGHAEQSYRDQMITSKLKSEALNTWFTGLTANKPITKGNTKYVPFGKSFNELLGFDVTATNNTSMM